MGKRTAKIPLEEYDDLKKVYEGQAQPVTLTNKFLHALNVRMAEHSNQTVRVAYLTALQQSLAVVKGSIESSGPDSLRVIPDPTL